MGFIPVIIALVTPIARRLLIALGIGVISYVGLSAILDQFVQAINAQMGSVSGDVLQITQLFGLQTSTGIILGALVTRISLLQLKRFGVL